MYRRTGIDAAGAAKSNRVLARAVAGGAHRTREQLAAELLKAGFAAGGLELAYRIMFAEASGVLVSGSPVRSAGGALKQTYALFDERVPPAPAGLLDRPAALAELARRYFTSRGPATEKDCADWSGLTVADVRSGLRLALESDPGSLGSARIDGVAYYFSRTPDTAGGGSGSGRIDLIQCYDEYVMGYSRSRHFLGGAAPFAPMAGEPVHLVLRDGRLAGVWRHSFVRGRCELDIRIGPPADPEVESAIDRAAAACGSYLGMPAVRL
ncbi:DNA glycosylase AlkZ-like family protein [Pseudarthrobacter sp. S9]|uniref:DNA glycosylase AlkZ-like family protein n=1 Tax=Pseudarthrobacter sp. S9 TaxID=3418421 RepID=UPI003CFF8701